MLVEIVKAIKWFMLMMLISILATWNAFVLLLKHRCTSDDADTICEKPRNLNTVFSTMYHMMNTLLFGYGDVNLFELTDYYVLVSIIFVISMIALPIVLLNMLIAIMGDSYELIQVGFAHHSPIVILTLELLFHAGSGPERIRDDESKHPSGK
jgi:hypothetical protein